MTCLLDTDSDVSLFPAGLVRPGTEIRSVNDAVWAANSSEMYLMGEVRLDALLEPRRFAVDFAVTPPGEFSILGEGCLYELGLLWDHRLNKVMVEGYTTN